MIDFSKPINNSLKFVKEFTEQDTETFLRLVAEDTKNGTHQIELEIFDGELLALASEDGNISLIKALVAAGADVNKADSLNKFPLLCASSVEVLDVLLDSGAEINYLVKNTALTWAVRFDEVEIVKRLIARGANVNIKNSNGATALMIAVNFDLPDMVFDLLNAGADPSIIDDNGLTVYEILAYKLKNIKMMNIFDNYHLNEASKISVKNIPLKGNTSNRLKRLRL